jgi:hypothetical protein
MYTYRANSNKSPVDIQVGILGTMWPVGHSHRLRAKLMTIILMHFVIASEMANLIPLQYIYSAYVLACMIVMR